MNLRDAAIHYAADLGWSVFPCGPKAKEPACEHGVKDATRDLDRIDKWWTRNPDSNIGLACGRASGVIAIDIDPRNSGDTSWAGVEAKCGKIPNTVEAITGGGGRHIILRTPDFPCRNGVLLPGVDLKSDNGYILVDPSIHPSGTPYTWELSSVPGEVEIAECPPWLVEALRKREKTATTPLGEIPVRVKTLLEHDEKFRLRWQGDTHGMNDPSRSALTASLAERMLYNRIPRSEIHSALVAWGRSIGYDKPEDERWRNVTIDGVDLLVADRHVGKPANNGTHAEEPKALFTTLSASDLIIQHPNLRPPLVDGLLREGETLNIVASPKVGKSWLAHALAVNFANSSPWLGLNTTGGNVLIIDGELHHETLAHRLGRVCKSLQIDHDRLKHSIDVWPVRGKRLTIHQIHEALTGTTPKPYKLIVVDALYRFLPTDGEENSNETMTTIYNMVDSIAHILRAGVVLIHHASKGSQSEKSVTDVGAGAGAQSRAADSHMILRRHEVEDAVVVDAVLRTWPRMEPFVLRWQNPGWAADTQGLDPERLYKPKRGSSSAPAQDPQPVKQWSVEVFAREIVGPEQSIREAIIARAKDAGLGVKQAESFLKRAVAEGAVTRLVDGWAIPHKFITSTGFQEPSR